ncbi:MAG: TOBE domain-containing protein [Candidatus Odinarchaeia archaeon]
MSEKVKVNFKVWFEKDGVPIIGAGGAGLLEAIKETGSLQAAVEKIGWSYRYAWGYLKKLEDRLGTPIVIPHKGGFKGGGGMELTQVGEEILKTYNRFNTFLFDSLNNPSMWMAYGLKNREISKLNGVISDIKIGGEAALISIDIDDPGEIISIITVDSIKNLGLSIGEEVDVVIKATEVMVDRR